MAKNLVDIRLEASTINQKIRAGQLASAVDALKDLLEALVSENLSRADKREMEGIAENGTLGIMMDPVVNKEFAMELKYMVGKERELITDLHVLKDAVGERNARLAEEARIAHMEKMRADIDEAIELYKNDTDTVKAERIFKKYFDDFRVDPFYLVKIGLMFSEIKLFEESIPYYTKAIELNGREADWYNYIAISLRKVHRFEDAEQYYLKVSKILGGDPHLFFNLARLYLDWEQWDKAIKAASAAVKLDPEFVEAQKLIKYANKQAKIAEEKRAEEARIAEEKAAEEAELQAVREKNDAIREERKAEDDAEIEEARAKDQAVKDARAEAEAEAEAEAKEKAEAEKEALE